MGSFSKFVETSPKGHEASFWSRFVNPTGEHRPLLSRRRVARLRCLEPAALQVGARLSCGFVTEVSITGLRVETPEPLEPGQTVSVKLEDTAAVKARVAWVQRGIATTTCGLWLQEPRVVLEVSWVAELLQRKSRGRAEIRPRQELRFACRLPARVLDVLSAEDYDVPAEAILVDFSLGGGLLETTVPVPQDCVIRLSWEWSSDRSVSLAARVLRSRPRHGKRLLHLRFVWLDEDQRRALRECAEFLQ